VTPDPNIVPRGVGVLTDEGRGHAPAVAQALADPRARDGALVLMADCPLVSGEAIDALAALARPVALARAADGGMNALAVRGTAAFEPAFGVRGAADVTAERARSAGIEPAVVEDPRLAFDVDEPKDVWRLREEGEGTKAHEVLQLILPATGGLR
jgi:2-phospho-L-lactate guanylyltransferase (CobY/MobA/RfbA family)